jgi:hypothetical protein
MKHLALVAAALLTTETAALACSCAPAETQAELKRYGTEIGKKAVALVEAEALTAYERRGRGERMRVIRTLAGTAPAEFRIERGEHASSASCDLLYRVGQRATVILYPTGATDSDLPVYRTAGLCTAQFVDEPAFRDAVIRALNARGERG